MTRPSQVRPWHLLAALLLAAPLGGCGGAAPLTFDLAALPASGRPVAAGRAIVVSEPVGIQTRIIQSLENAGRLRSVSRPGDKVSADYQLISEIRAFDLQAGTGEAVVDLSLKLVADGSGKVAAAKIFTARVPVARIDAGNGARALDQALVTVLGDVVRWVNTGR